MDSGYVKAWPSIILDTGHKAPLPPTWSPQCGEDFRSFLQTNLEAHFPLTQFGRIVCPVMCGIEGRVSK